jgi:hypothetical protein
VSSGRLAGEVLVPMRARAAAPDEVWEAWEAQMADFEVDTIAGGGWWTCDRLGDPRAIHYAFGGPAFIIRAVIAAATAFLAKWARL